MSEVFLNQLQLLNFRTFGKFALDVAPAPGLVLLVGTNGLGKSSFFDAIEWGLTGQIRRFQSYLTASISEADYLTRRDAPPNSHEVRLQFNLGDPLIRTADHAPDPAKVIELLKKRDWEAPIQDSHVPGLHPLPRPSRPTAVHQPRPRRAMGVTQGP